VIAPGNISTTWLRTGAAIGETRLILGTWIASTVFALRLIPSLVSTNTAVGHFPRQSVGMRRGKMSTRRAAH
jgi:hypothetical protein